MSDPITAAKLISQLKRWGVVVVQHDGPGFTDTGDGWKTHNRGNRGKGFAPRGLMWHHVGSDVQSTAVLWNGRPGLPGPLSQAATDAQGRVHLIGHGRANHAGGGDPAVLKKVTSEKYSGILVPEYGEGDDGAEDGNAYFYGNEFIYSGSHGMTPAQYQAGLRWSCALLEHHKWNEKSTIGHGEWSEDKWDPGYKSGKMMDMEKVRLDIHRLLEKGPQTYREYTVKDGDTLWGIAKRELGDGDRYEEIVRLNPINDPDEIEPGMKLKLPNK
jgi:LysM repeat protein